MKSVSPFSQPYDQLPDRLPVFPLAQAVVLPGGHLPLNIFEPRYLNLVTDAMTTHRLVGMVQPLGTDDDSALYQVGCAGRIVRYTETRDGRLEIVLNGLCRFRILEELDETRGYRQVRPDWSEFKNDYDEPEALPDSDTANLRQALGTYLESNSMTADMEGLDQLGADELSNALVSVLPLGVEAKQWLLESNSLDQRAQGLVEILTGPGEGNEIRH